MSPNVRKAAVTAHVPPYSTKEFKAKMDKSSNKMPWWVKVFAGISAIGIAAVVYLHLTGQMAWHGMHGQ